jgi:uncharacterized membrane protein
MTARINQWLSLLLMVGILLSLILVFLGGVFYLIQEGQQPIHYQSFSSLSTPYTSFSSIRQGLMSWQPLAFVELGFLILVLSQILRVLVLGCFFWSLAEYLLAFSSFFIFLILIYSMLWHE